GAAARVPALVAERIDGAVLLPEDGHIDVHALLSAYLRHARRAGGVQRWSAAVRGIRVVSGRVQAVVTDDGEIPAGCGVNAAGVWAPSRGPLAGAAARDLIPHRRTIVVFDVPCDVRRWPLVASDADQLYFAPESGGLKLSPMDEEPMAACDPAPGD